MTDKITRVFDCIQYQNNNFPQEKSLVYKKNNEWKSYSSQDFINISNKVSRSLLALGVKPNDKIALIVPVNQPKWHFLDIGILQIGVQNVPLYATLSEKDYQYVLNHSDCKYCFIAGDDIYEKVKKVLDKTQLKEVFRIDRQSDIGWESFLKLGKDETSQAKVEELKKSIKPKDLATIIYTSGTTGQPKGAELTHSNLVMNAMVCQEFIHIRTDDTQLIVLPLFHIFAMTVQMNMGIYKGIHSILLPRFDANDAYKLMIKHQVSVFAGVPTMYWGLINNLDESADLSKISQHLRLAVSGGAALPMTVLNDFKHKFGLKILEGYGMSEGSPVVTFNQPDVGFKPGSIGTPIWGVQVKLIDNNGKEVAQGEKGELCYKGHNVMKGYYNRPNANAETIINGWLHSGDVAIKDEDGFYFIVDRTKDMIIRGGLNVYPRQVEEVMIQHEAVSLVAVIGIPDEKMGEEIKAFVVLNEGMYVSEGDLKAYTKERIANYKYPRKVEFLAALPMSATGKILKLSLIHI